MGGRGLFIVMASMVPEKEGAFNQWYNEEQLPRVLERLPGILSARRYKIIRGETKYRFMAMYEFESYEALEAAMNTEQASELAREYDKAFGEGGRYHIHAIELKSVIVG